MGKGVDNTQYHERSKKETDWPQCAKDGAVSTKKTISTGRRFLLKHQPTQRNDRDVKNKVKII